MSAPASARSAAEGDAGRWAIRAGWGAKGVVYALVAVLALQVAAGGSDRQADQQGALRTVAEQPLGSALLVVLAVGLLAYAAGRVADATVLAGADDKAVERAGWLVSAVLYLALGALALSLALGRESGTGSGSSGDPSGITARVMDAPAGRWVVALVGLVIVGAGAFQAKKGVSRDFLDELEHRSTWVERVGVVGLIARAVVFALVGWFAVQAALQYDAEEAKGLDGALQEVAAAPYGPFLLGLVAIGLAAYAAHCATQARWRRVDHS